MSYFCYVATLFFLLKPSSIRLGRLYFAASLFLLNTSIFKSNTQFYSIHACGGPSIKFKISAEQYSQVFKKTTSSSKAVAIQIAIAGLLFEARKFVLCHHRAKNKKHHQEKTADHQFIVTKRIRNQEHQVWQKISHPQQKISVSTYSFPDFWLSQNRVCHLFAAVKVTYCACFKAPYCGSAICRSCQGEVCVSKVTLVCLHRVVNKQCFSILLRVN